MKMGFSQNLKIGSILSQMLEKKNNMHKLLSLN
jgi:hypothetical protein